MLWLSRGAAVEGPFRVAFGVSCPRIAPGAARCESGLFRFPAFLLPLRFLLVRRSRFVVFPLPAPPLPPPFPALRAPLPARRRVLVGGGGRVGRRVAGRAGALGGRQPTPSSAQDEAARPAHETHMHKPQPRRPTYDNFMQGWAAALSAHGSLPLSVACRRFHNRAKSSSLTQGEAMLGSCVCLSNSAEFGLKMHNWLIYEMTPDLYKEDIGRAIASGKLMYPLFPCESLFDWNRVLANEVLQEIHGGSPGSKGEKTSYGRQLFGSQKAVEPLIGGGPQTTVPIYADGNPHPVGRADTTPISAGMTELYGLITQVGQQNNTLRTQALAHQRKIKALEEQLQSLNVQSGINSRGFATRGRGTRSGRAGGRGTFGRGRGNSYNSGYYRGGEPEYDQYDESYDTPKNA